MTCSSSEMRNPRKGIEWREGSRIRRAFRHAAFSLLEAVVAVLIFSLLMITVAMVWSVSWKASERIARGGAHDQGAPLVLQRLTQAVEASVFREQPAQLYAWRGEDQGGGGEEWDRVSFVTSMAPDVAESSRETAPLERVMIQAQARDGGGHQLVMLAGPLTMDDKDWQRQTVLLDHLASFRLRYWSEERRDWVDGWRDDGHAPRAVQISLAVKGENLDLTMDVWSHRAMAWVRPPLKVDASLQPSQTSGTGANAPVLKINPGPP